MTDAESKTIDKPLKSETSDSSSPIHVAIIGTACRGEDAGKIDGALFGRMVNAAMDVIDEEWKLPRPRVVLVSGGAAGADHVAVCLWDELRMEWKGLQLHLPCEWDAKRMQGDTSTSCGRTMNGYHVAFGKCIDRNTLQDLERVRRRGATLVTTASGFHARNTNVAKQADFMLAFTWHDSETEPKPGSGTADTWNKSGKHCRKRHVSLRSLASMPGEKE